jgi:hypothetical protein
MIEEAKKRFSLPYSCLARQLGFSYRTLMRWKSRLAKARAAVGKRGPKAVQPLDLGELKERIQGLDHGRKRSRGVGAIHKDYAGRISRRELDEMIRRVRNECNRHRAAETCRASWLRPNLAWALDDCRKSNTMGKRTLHLHNLTGLCSRYGLPPIASGQLACGEEVAGHLDRLFACFGAPLFCKRDNGGNLNHAAVNDVLEQALMIPLNSPPYTASYNGAVEHTQGEFKRYIERRQWEADTIKAFSLLAETAAHDLNHQPRRCLKGKTACTVYFGNNRLRYPKRLRRAAYRWIRDLASEISIRTEMSVITSVAWRVAAKQWMVKNNLIKIVKAGKVLPHFSSKLCHN